MNYIQPASSICVFTSLYFLFTPTRRERLTALQGSLDHSEPMPELLFKQQLRMSHLGIWEWVGEDFNKRVFSPKRWVKLGPHGVLYLGCMKVYLFLWIITISFPGQIQNTRLAWHFQGFLTGLQIPLVGRSLQ